MRKFWTILRHAFVYVFVPEIDPIHWPILPFRPFLYPATFVGAIVIATGGDFTVPREFGTEYHSPHIPLMWCASALLAPIFALIALNLVTHGHGKKRLYGYWLRLIADVMQFGSLFTYDLMRISLSGGNVLLTYVTIAATAFMLTLVMRDVKQIRRNEGLATKIDEGLVPLERSDIR